MEFRVIRLRKRGPISAQVLLSLAFEATSVRVPKVGCATFERCLGACGISHQGGPPEVRDLILPRPSVDEDDSSVSCCWYRSCYIIGTKVWTHGPPC